MVAHGQPHISGRDRVHPHRHDRAEPLLHGGADLTHTDLPTSAPEALDLKLDSVGHTYQAGKKQIHALEDIDLHINHGEFVTIIGPSGCGKSTLLMIAAGLELPTAGEVHIGGHKVTGPFTDSGFVFQDASLLDWRTTLKNILLQAEARGMDPEHAQQRARELMDLTGIGGFEDVYPTELSGGMRQRVSICRALLHDPPILFMDEPFGALDAMTREQMMLDTQDLWLHGDKTVLFVTHDIGEALVLADKVVVLGPRPGRILKIYDVPFPRPRSMDTLGEPTATEMQHEIRELLREHGAF
ncbi:MAG: ATP-binding cassette domain-containing protein [Acidimicrobiia bacterium]|nr:ATP-binding cassette domain-containing protein [Acidimicrobiia bacterium]